MGGPKSEVPPMTEEEKLRIRAFMAMFPNAQLFFFVISVSVTLQGRGPHVFGAWRRACDFEVDQILNNPALISKATLPYPDVPMPPPSKSQILASRKHMMAPTLETSFPTLWAEYLETLPDD